MTLHSEVKAKKNELAYADLQFLANLEAILVFSFFHYSILVDLLHHMTIIKR